MLLFLLFLGSEHCKFEKWPTDNAQKMTLLRCWMSECGEVPCPWLLLLK